MSRPVVPIVRKLISSSKVGVVVSAGRMSRAVKVRIAGQEWNKRFQKHFPSNETYLVADPNNSLVEGDVVRIASGWRTSKHIRHVVTSIVAPFGEPVENRPPVLTDEERMAVRIKERLLKDVRSAQRGRLTSIQRLRQARKEGFEIPSLEEATANLSVAEQEEIKAKERAKEAHAGQAGQGVVKKERRMSTGQKTKDERIAEKQIKKARAQTA